MSREDKSSLLDFCRKLFTEQDFTISLKISVAKSYKISYDEEVYYLFKSIQERLKNMAIGKKNTVLMKAVSELKEADYSGNPELNRIYRRLLGGRKQFAEIFEKNIKAVMQISSLDLTMHHQTEKILDISRNVEKATEAIFGSEIGRAHV